MFKLNNCIQLSWFPMKKCLGSSQGVLEVGFCLVFNPIMVEGYAALFSCTAVVQASDSMTASM